ncbi:MAG: glycerol-3-phosphate 1-O-acyltransferase PlsY [Candidatus Omnitrophica bacterium]|nr:glycerol-3-phosphate 1-O-acyltransferase PlsY [Candidatus Omnitrophota bacterium]MCM8825987.1 glycerol-3-phosphate 1-O-acyltransferase PlsY [Candidatus Omnitrophota bacterium]
MWILPLIISYLLGSIPFGFILTYLIRRIDIRDYGSGNIGATNVARILGKKLGIYVFLLDFLKGSLSIWIFKLFPFPSGSSYLFLLCGLAAVCGHNWPIFLGFRGGKGVATSLGVMSSLSFVYTYLWLVLTIAVVSWLISFFIFRYVSLASLLAGSIFFIFSLILPVSRDIKILSLLLLLLLIFRHKNNIVNLIHGKELGWRKPVNTN